MHSSSSSLIPALFLSLVPLLLSVLPTPSQSTNTQSFLFGGCSHTKVDPNSPIESNLNSLLTSLINSATYLPYNHFTVTGPSSNDVVYGLYQCRGDLSMPDCANCISTAVRKLVAMCPETTGGSLQLQGCFVQYDQEPIIGVEDKTVVLKKCGPSMGGGYGQKISARDQVLDTLLSGGNSGAYRVSGSRDMQAMGQCVGDLSGDECQDCLTDAVKRLKGECATGAYGDMFFAKCYVRYSMGGNNAYAKPNNGSSEHHGIKTFALVIGSLAAVVIFIIFLTFLCRVFAGSNK